MTRAQRTGSLDHYYADENDFKSANAGSRLRRRWRICDDDPLRRDSLGESFAGCGALSYDEQYLAKPDSIETRRLWEAYRREVLPRIHFFKRVVDKYLVKKAANQCLRLALHNWQRAAQIESSLGAYQVLVRRHRVYFVRKALLRACWSLISRTFLQWRQFTDQSAAALRRIAESYDRQVKRLVLGKWYHRLLITERLEEQAAASVWMWRQRKRTQAVDRKLLRVEKQLLVSYWINWRANVRQWKCSHSDRRLRFQNRRVFVQWTRFVTRRKYERERRWEPVRLLVGEFIQNSVFQAHIKQTWVAESQQLHLAVHVIEHIATAYQRQRNMQIAFRTWRTAAIDHSRERTEPIEQQVVELRKIRLPERISALYQRSKAPGDQASVAKRRATHRPHWR